MESQTIIGDYIIEVSYELSQKMNEDLDKEFIQTIISQQELEQLNEWRAQFLSYIGEAIKEKNKEVTWDQVTEWARTTGESAVEREISLDESLTTLTSYRIVIWNAILEKLNEVSLSNEELIDIGFIIDSLVDHAGSVFSTSFVEYHRNTVDLAQKAVFEYSVPVVGLSDSVAILPLIGELDTNRARLLKENALYNCVELGNSILIIDLSGVPIVDTMVANEIFQVVSSLKLIGVQTILTGVRPEIAQSIVKLGLNFKGVTIKSSLKHAIVELQSKGEF
ncbi:STAS domain-containing protein [Halalkalibacter nanhaiisediminis]|uniref:RsbT co-antagonist protein RsbR n=1 Tax=Halalkalibacter nanhaiisediminis TaxID=688079 RepID=A0A562QSY0_9BACI|nr:STAS domain-containing protein [Halalkalibacter nanhaiisediminis]TWI59844.1 rsbT co-antagonist protein RsbR [Halalkalibacter nanhaiisediminis]